MTSLLRPRATRGSMVAPFLLAGLGALLALAALAAHPPRVAALSCIAPPPMAEAVAQAEIAFVGTVTAVANDAHLASVSVEEVWVGPDMPEVVEVGNVRPANDPELVWDRTYTQGVRYLFLPTIEEGRLVDSPCGFTSEWQPEFEQVRPATIRTPGVATPTPGPDPVAALGELVVPIGGVAILAIVIIGGAMLVSRREA